MIMARVIMIYGVLRKFKNDFLRIVLNYLLFDKILLGEYCSDDKLLFDEFILDDLFYRRIFFTNCFTFFYHYCYSYDYYQFLLLLPCLEIKRVILQIMYLVEI